jgi:chromosome partitioning protein
MVSERPTQHAPDTKKVIAIVNQKGGVGKTTTAVNLATGLAAVRKKTLIIDLDPQGNASTGVGITQEARLSIGTIYDVIAGKISIEKATRKTAVPHLSVITADMHLAAAEMELASVEDREFVLRALVDAVAPEYDYILIDCPPSLGLLTVNALVAASTVLIPVQCEYFALEGLSHLLKTIKLVKKRLNPALRIEGLVLTMYDKRNRLTEQVESEVREYFNDLVFSTVIPRNVRLSEAPSHGKPAIIYDLHCPGSKAYMLLARELLKRQKPASLPHAPVEGGATKAASRSSTIHEAA